jgi:hypothetical protein
MNQDRTLSLYQTSQPMANSARGAPMEIILSSGIDVILGKLSEKILNVLIDRLAEKSGLLEKLRGVPSKEAAVQRALAAAYAEFSLAFLRHPLASMKFT